ncbi:MAG: response regulator [Niabella sp.]
MSKLPKPNTVMLIDDSHFDRLIISRTIEHTGLLHNIIIFPNATEALHYLQNNINNKNLLPQLILLDIQMPEVNGFDFMEQYILLPQYFTNTCIVAMLSSTEDPNDIAKAEANPQIVSLLKKPMHPNMLVHLLNTYFEAE